jgi:DNA-binding MarR family transcriptional regulator
MRARARNGYPLQVLPPQPDPIAAWRAVLLAQSRALRAIEADLDAAGVIPLSWYDVLLELNATPDRRLRMQELGRRAVLSRTRVSRIVTDLEAAGLAAREPDPSDSRATLAAITPAGRAALKAAAPHYLAGIEQHFTRYLTPAQQRAVADGLMQVVLAHEAALDPRR